MTTYRLWPATNGGSLASYSGNFIAGTVFTVKGGGNWFNGYYWWVPAGGDTTAVKCALWSVESASGGYLVPGSVVTSGTLTANSWNFIPLAAPVQLAPGYDGTTSTNSSCYIAAVGWVASSGFPDTNGYWGTGGAGAGGIANGPLVAFSAASGSGGTLAPPYSLPQGVFTTGGSDPSATMPTQQSGTDNFWVDVQVSDTAPAGYSGSYRLWPNKADANPTVSGDAAVNYTVATEISLSQACTLNDVWFFSVGGATTFPTRCDVWNIGTGLSVASITSPSWKDITGAAATPGAHQSGALGQWVKAAFAANTTLPAGDYRVSAFNANGTTDSNWNTKDASTDYWGETNSGAGSGGITWGPVSAPKYSAAQGGFTYNAANSGATPPYNGGTAAHAQSVFGQNPGGTIQFPQLYAPVGAGTNQSQNYWVDLEVTPLPPAFPFAAIAQRRQAWPRGLPRRGRILPPVRAQLNPPYQFSEIAQRRETWPRGIPRRGRATFVVPPQLNPPYPFAEIAQRRQAHPRALLRRGRLVTPVPPQLNPPYPVAELRQWRQLRGLLPRRGHAFAPVPAQQAAAPNPAITFQPLRHPALALAPRRGRVVQAPLAQVSVAAPAWVQSHRAPLRALALIRRRFLQLIPWPQAVKPPFTPGLITAADRPSTVLSGGDAAAGALTGTTQTTGGPG